MLKRWMIGVSFLSLLGLDHVQAGTVKAYLNGTASQVCSYYGQVDIDASGNVQITGCTSGGTTTFPLSLSALGNGSGTITSDPSGVNCISNSGTTSGTCTSNFTSGVEVTLTESPAVGSNFSNWSGVCSGTGVSCTVKMDASKNVTATFTSAGSGSCAGITPFEILNQAPYPSLGTTSYSMRAILANQSGYATGSVAFVATADYPISNGYWGLSYNETPGAARTEVYTAISICPGDMRGAGTAGGSADDIKCRTADANTDGSGLLFSTKQDTRWCKLTPGTTYYVNIKSKNQMTGIGFIFGIQ